MPRTGVLATVLSVAIVVAGCGGSKNEGSNSKTTATAGTSAGQAAGTAPAVANATDLKTKPQIATPKGFPPDKLVSKDLVVGQGPAAKAGDQLTVRYVGISWSTGKQFDASWDRKPNSFPFKLGQGAVIKGWDQGVVGMKAGGRRELVIPADLGYGANGSPPAIQPYETLVFVIDLVKIG